MAQTRFKVEDGLLVRGQANITGNTVISGTLELGNDVVTGINANGNITPVSNNTFTLGTTNSRWSRVFANSGAFSNTVEITGQANLYGGAHLRGSLSFNNNTHSIGNTTAMPSVTHSSNVIIYDTLSVANGSMVVNTSTTSLGSNIVTSGSKITLKTDKLNIISHTPNSAISTNPSAPTTIHEIQISSGVNLAKYLIFCRNNETNEVQSSEVTLLFKDSTSDITIGEHAIMSSNGTPFVSYDAFLNPDSTLIRLTAHASHANISINMHLTTLT
jgi:hypothetical protein